MELLNLGEISTSRLKNAPQGIQGFEKSSVNDLLNKVKESYNEMLQECDRLTSENERLKGIEIEFNASQTAVGTALIEAQRQAMAITEQAEQEVSQIKEDAKAEAKLITDESAKEGRRILKESQTEAEEILSRATADANSLVEKSKHEANGVIDEAMSNIQVLQIGIAEQEEKALSFQEQTIKMAEMLIDNIKNIDFSQKSERVTSFNEKYEPIETSSIDFGGANTPDNVGLESDLPQQEDIVNNMFSNILKGRS